MCCLHLQGRCSRERQTSHEGRVTVTQKVVNHARMWVFENGDKDNVWVHDTTGEHLVLRDTDMDRK